MNEGEIVAAVGALAGAIGSLWFVARSVPSGDTAFGVGKRRLALMIVLAVYVVMALFTSIIGAALQATGVAAGAG